MRALTLAFAASLVAAAAGAAAADAPAAVWTTQEVRLRARPGETAAVVARAERGEQMAVVDEWGRWLRVRHGRRVGWLTRAEVEVRAGGAEPPRPRARRGGFSGKAVEDALQVTVEADRVRGFDDPRTKATCVLDLSRGDTVTVIGRGHDGWILVEHATGVVGWIPAAAVTDGGQFAGDPRRAKGMPATSRDDGDVRITTERGDDGDDAAAARAPRATATAPAAAGRARRADRRRIVGTVAGAAGAQTFAMRQTGAGESMAIARGPAAAVAASAHVRLAGDLWLAAGTDAELGTGDLVYYTAAEQSAPMATRGLAVDAGASLAWGRTWQVAARAGYHYASLAVESDRAEPMLIGEQVAGLTVGVGGALPLGRRAALAAAVDVMPAGAQRPAELPAGVLYATGMRGAWARASVAVRLPARLVGIVAYRGGVATANLTDGAATPTTATRTDQSHAVTAGLGLSW